MLVAILTIFCLILILITFRYYKEFAKDMIIIGLIATALYNDVTDLITDGPIIEHIATLVFDAIACCLIVTRIDFIKNYFWKEGEDG